MSPHMQKQSHLHSLHRLKNMASSDITVELKEAYNNRSILKLLRIFFNRISDVSAPFTSSVSSLREGPNVVEVFRSASHAEFLGYQQYVGGLTQGETVVDDGIVDAQMTESEKLAKQTADDALTREGWYQISQAAITLDHLCVNNQRKGITTENDQIRLIIAKHECCKNGKNYKEGEEFEIGHLRYKCQKYGVYSIEGCITEGKQHLKLGETVVIDHVKAQCLAKGSSVFYRETVCGMLGQPECDKVDLPSGYKEAVAREQSRPKEKSLSVEGLPPGWKVVDQTVQGIPGSGGKQVVSRTLMFEPILGASSRARRQSGHGIGSVVGIEDVGTERPPMPMSMLLNGGKNVSQSGKKEDSPTVTTKSPTIQHVSSKLVIQEKSKERVVGVGTGSRDLNSRTPTITNAKGLKPESVSGSRSDVDWKGRKIVVNGRTIGTGEGTFTFSNRPTGAAAKKEH